MVRDKLRIRFRKAGDLRLVSHHDLMRCFERMLRRAAVPFHSTEGFNPKPRMIFALSLGLGIVGCEEVVELELDAQLPTEEVRDRLAREAPDGLEILGVKRIDPKVTAHVRRACYRLPMPPGHATELPTRIAALLATPECWIERTRPHRRRINLRPYLRDIRLESDGLVLDLWITPTGAARPDEIVQLLGLSDLLAAGGVFERTVLELDDETESEEPSELTEHSLPEPPAEPVANGAPADRAPAATSAILDPVSGQS